MVDINSACFVSPGAVLDIWQPFIGLGQPKSFFENSIPVLQSICNVSRSPTTELLKCIPRQTDKATATLFICCSLLLTVKFFPTLALDRCRHDQSPTPFYRLTLPSVFSRKYSLLGGKKEHELMFILFARYPSFVDHYKYFEVVVYLLCRLISYWVNQ